MGSENNMLAVPVECTDEIAEAIAMEANVCGGIAETIWRKAVAAARLASPQPDAQQGEAESVAATFEKAEIWTPNAPAPRMSGPAVARRIRALIAAATPPSPALDAATIERLHAFAQEYVRVWEAGTGTVYLIEQARSALPNAEKRHG